MYPKSETDFSWSYLTQIIRRVPQPCCLIGGWSVYLTVNQAFEKKTGRSYVGSRDIDLGFHFDPDWSQKEVKSSPFSMAVKEIEAMGFEPQGSRFVKQYHHSQKRELTQEEKRHLPSYEIFNLYIDILVDSDDPKRFKKAGFNVMEEPLLNGVFRWERENRNETGRNQCIDASTPTSYENENQVFPRQDAGRQEDKGPRRFGCPSSFLRLQASYFGKQGTRGELLTRTKQHYEGGMESHCG